MGLHQTNVGIVLTSCSFVSVSVTLSLSLSLSLGHIGRFV